jgi:alpha-glucosidase
MPYFHKIPHPANFIFAPGAAEWDIRALGGDVFRLRLARRRWRNPSQVRLARSIPGGSTCSIGIAADDTLTVRDARGRALLASVPGATFGRSGATWLLQFRHERGTQFYGLGEHSRGFEKSGQRVKFWNTDLMADFAFEEVRHGFPNPMYVSVPWLIVKRGNTFVGLFVHHPGAVFMELASNFVWDAGNTSDRDRRSFYLGAPDGEPDVFVVVGPSLAELTRKFQTLVGRTPLPPLWALGYHQSRWGYAGPRDLLRLDRELARRRIPCDGLWLDIDHMDRLKVFTFSPRHWKTPEKTRAVLAALRARGRRVVPILDPGVKVEPGYPVYDEGIAREVFCRNPAGRPYVGFVWPGQTHFPDFSRPEARAWWAERVAALARTGVAAAWIDMNDPSTGAAECDDMRFDRGRRPHASYHNEYALGMAEATRAGFLAARPDERPFVLSRSACASSSRHTAVWTGDNLSNWHHLRLAIPVSLGLALSGLPFCGPDVCGFGLDATRALAIAWHKLQFLFPFFRNHCSLGQRDQEPWAFGPGAGRVLAHYLRLRYKFLPYLYQLFVAQELTGDAILRPLFHEFPDRAAQPLGGIADQFMIGAALLQAPVVEENATAREVLLPAGTAWFSLLDGRWHEGGRTLSVRCGEAETPLFVREGSLLPLRPGLPETQDCDLREIELHALVRTDRRGRAACVYHADDGVSFGYRRGERTSVGFDLRVARDGQIGLRATPRARGYGRLRVKLVLYGDVARATLTTPSGSRVLALTPLRWRAAGGTLHTRASVFFEI